VDRRRLVRVLPGAANAALADPEGSTSAIVPALAAALGQKAPLAARRTARYAIDGVTPKSSSSSLTVCSPARYSPTRCASCIGLSLGCLPRKRPLALATFMPSRVRANQAGFELGDHGQYVEQQPPDRVGRVVH
jgi:hypothetical protein